MVVQYYNKLLFFYSFSFSEKTHKKGTRKEHVKMAVFRHLQAFYAFLILYDVIPHRQKYKMSVG